MKEFFSINLEKLSIINFLWLIFLGILLFVIINLTKKYLFVLVIKSPLKREKVQTKIPVLEITLWMLYALHAMYVLILPFPFFGVIVLGILIYILRKELNNLIQGLIFRYKGVVEKDERISINNKEGRVESFNLFDVYFEDKEGEIEVIDYADLVKQTIVKKEFSSEYFSYKFSIKTKSDILASDIEKQILQLPWSTSVYPPKVILVKEQEENNYFDVLVYAIDKRYFSFIEDDIRKMNAF